MEPWALYVDRRRTWPLCGPANATLGCEKEGPFRSVRHELWEVCMIRELAQPGLLKCAVQDSEASYLQECLALWRKSPTTMYQILWACISTQKFRTISHDHTVLLSDIGSHKAGNRLGGCQKPNIQAPGTLQKEILLTCPSEAWGVGPVKELQGPGKHIGTTRIACSYMLNGDGSSTCGQNSPANGSHSSEEDLVWGTEVREFGAHSLYAHAEEGLVKGAGFVIHASYDSGDGPGMRHSLPGRAMRPHNSIWGPTSRAYGLKGSFTADCSIKMRDPLEFWGFSVLFWGLCKVYIYIERERLSYYTVRNLLRIRDLPDVSGFSNLNKLFMGYNWKIRIYVEMVFQQCFWMTPNIQTRLGG